MSFARRCPLLVLACALLSGSARAADALPDAAASTQSRAGEESIQVTVKGKRPGQDGATPGRAVTSVTRRELEERMPRSAPDALRYEPGVFVQQTGAGQASAYIRGRTGQQTALMFDGIRLNTSTWRQGPNQYFFTVDTYTIQRMDISRGGSSTQYGSDAIGGAIDSIPVEPRHEEGAGTRVRPRTFLRYASADSSFGERFQVDTQVSEQVQVLVGTGYKRVGRLRAGGPVYSPVTGELAQVPVFESDGRTQRGTGYRELTADARAVYRLSDSRKVTAAAYLFREYDAPRTDQCPAPGAPLGECLNIDQQFRTLVYGAYDGDLGKLASSARIALSYQRQHEQRTLHRPNPAFVRYGGRDDVNTFGLTSKLMTRWFEVTSGVRSRIRYGADAYVDTVSSSAYLEFYNLDILIRQSRGQYLSGSSYAQGGAFGLWEVALGEQVLVRAGGRAGLARARTPSDPESGTAGVDRAWPLLAGALGAEWAALPWLSLLGNLDRSVRAPNLDDLTSRQQTGPGFQFENPNLRAELGTTVEAGVRLEGHHVTLEAWAYRSWLDQAITRAIRSEADCPPETPQCNSSKRRVQLVNLAGTSTIDGTELWARARWPGVAVATASLSYAVGEGPSPAAPGASDAGREPLSRIPPLHGAADLRLGRPRGLFAGAGLRWAARQTRLATTDYGDPRIPRGGTPGFAVLDLRCGYRMERDLIAAVVLENATDAAYRYHGSAINGPGRGIILSLEAGL